MIGQILWDLLELIILAGLALFPTWEPPVNTPAWSALSAANMVLPLDVWSVCMGVTLAAMGAGLLVWVIMKALNLVRGSGA